MTEKATRLLDTHTGDDGITFAETFFSPVSNKERACFMASPSTTVPVVFVPGIMGSNLKAKTNIGSRSDLFATHGERIWNVEAKRHLLEWALKDSVYRQAVLNHAVVEVDNSGIRTGGETSLSLVSLKEARKRGWGSAGWAFYGSFLDWLEYQLNKGHIINDGPNDIFQRIVGLVGRAPADINGSNLPLTEEQVYKTLDIHFPVYAVGYNWLQSNLQSGADLMHGTGSGDGRVLGINEIIERENNKPGQNCTQVIVITHSMGGLVARAAALKQGGEEQILGIIHGVQPIDGAAKFYKALAAGFGGISGYVLGATAKETVPEIAYNPGPLQLAPNKRYNNKKPWLIVRDQRGNTIKLPRNGDPYKEIYMDTTSVWRAVNPELLDPGNRMEAPSVAYKETVKVARNFHDPAYGGIAGQLHPQTYAHWGDDPDYASYGTVTWGTDRPLPLSNTTPQDWVLYNKPPAFKDGRHRHVARGDDAITLISIEPPEASGDGTVPADASAAQIAQYDGCRKACALKGFEHSDDFNNNAVRDVVLDAIVRLVEPVNITE